MANCQHCGVKFEVDDLCTNPECPAADSAAEALSPPQKPSVPSPLASGGDMAMVPRPPLARRLGGSALELGTLVAVEMVGSLLMGFTFGVSGVVSSLIAAIYMGVKDLDGGRYSFGKRAVGTRVVDATTLQRATPGKAFLRNLPWVLFWTLAIVPVIGDFIGWTLLALMAIIDLGMIVATPTGRRLGDLLANTQVVPEERNP
jgi:uncharacterized RDD family membrane protein YckC